MGDKYCYLLCSQHEGNQQEEEESIGLSKPRVAIRPILHCNEIPVPVFESLPELELPDFEKDQASVLSTVAASIAFSIRHKFEPDFSCLSHSFMFALFRCSLI